MDWSVTECKENYYGMQLLFADQYLSSKFIPILMIISSFFTFKIGHSLDNVQ